MKVIPLALLVCTSIFPVVSQAAWDPYWDAYIAVRDACERQYRTRAERQACAKPAWDNYLACKGRGPGTCSAPPSLHTPAAYEIPETGDRVNGNEISAASGSAELEDLSEFERRRKETTTIDSVESL